MRILMELIQKKQSIMKLETLWM